MLFHSLEFIFLFLPAVFTGYYFLLNKRLIEPAKGWLVAASLFFYAWWNPVYLPLIVISVDVNFWIGRLLLQGAKNRKHILFTGIALNLIGLGYFKYWDFFIGTVNHLAKGNLPLLNLVLPLAISFFTFQQISFLVDVYKGKTRENNLLDYALFVTFFPQLIAGPIVHHREIIPQFHRVRNYVMNYKNITLGILLFFMGLFKKAVLADTLAPVANEGFDAAESLTFVEAWVTSLSYTMQIYFDFSGYTDMALGIALLFNIKLPENFRSPYKAKSIQEFWRRWHITLSRFLTDYIYIPLGGSRKGKARILINIMLVFLISGLWHGAGWLFVFWGFLHGAAMVVNRIWSETKIKLPGFLAWFITINFINIAWVFFRAETWGDAWKVLKGMAGLSGFEMFDWLQSSPLGFLAGLGVKFSELPIELDPDEPVTLIFFAGLLAALFMKNSLEISERFTPRKNISLLIVALMSVSLLYMLYFTVKSEFIYFNF